MTMRDGGQTDLEHRLRDLSDRLEELSAEPAGATSAEEFVALFQEKRRIEENLRSAAEPRSRNRALGSRATKPAHAGADSDSVLANVNRALRKLEKRDGELWLIVTLTGVLVGAGLLAVLLPAAFLKSGTLHFEITVSRELACSLLVLLILINTYVVSHRIDVRRLRQKMISTAMQNELIRLQSFTDPLTEIYNRRSLEDLAGRFIGQAKRLRNPLTFLLVDLDRFKQVNTKFGHLTGDFVLTEVATLLKSSIRGTDAAIRYGGDEFLVALANTDASGAVTVVDRIQTFLDEWNLSSGLDDFTVGLSIGMAEWKDGKTLDEVLDLADRNMYEEKFHGAPSPESAAEKVVPLSRPANKTSN
jgi:diguanylate cyclase (GGDEF)-like protein